MRNRILKNDCDEHIKQIAKDLISVSKGHFTKDVVKKYGAYATHDNNKLDPLMIPILLTLIQKGYETEFSCSGHYKPDIWVNKRTKQIRECYNVGIYILFHGLYRIKDIPEGFMAEANEPDKTHYPVPRLNIRISYKNFVKLSNLKNEEALISNITKYLNSLLSWAKKLPEVNNG